MKICLDPGHFGSKYNPGVAAGYVESNFTWDYYLLMKSRLEQKYGVEVIGTRKSKDDYPQKLNGSDDLQARGRMSEGCDLFISIHSNATSDPAQNAMFCHWSVTTGGEGIAKAIGEGLNKFFVNEWRNFKVLKAQCYCVESEKHPGQDYYGVLLGAARVGTPAIIVEHSFHTNPRYCEWAMQSGNIERMADAEVDIIAKYYNLQPLSFGDAYYFNLGEDLKKGDKGDAVRKLQCRMRQVSEEFDKEVEGHSFVDGQPDGKFGGSMVKTMMKFQEKAGLDVTGELDTETRKLLNANIADTNKWLLTKEKELEDVRAVLMETRTEFSAIQEKVKTARRALE